MRTIAELKSTLPQVGKLEWIGLRPKRKSEVVEVDEVAITVNGGLNGDHNTREGGKRMITLIQSEHLSAVSSLLGRAVDPGRTRRNIVVKGINLNALHDTSFSIGDEVVLKGTGHCHPCSRMEENLGEGGYNAMRGHGGITATVIRGGIVKIGDKVAILKDKPLLKVIS